MRLGRVTAALLAGGFMLLVAGLALYSLPASAASGDNPAGAERPFEYTRHASRASTGRAVFVYVGRDFAEYERQNVVSAIGQWNYVLNGMVRLEARLLPDDPSPSDLRRVQRSGGWLIVRVDSRHPVAHRGVGRHALALTVGHRGGYVYVISDRIGARDLTGVFLHEFGHVLGAGHDQAGLMAPVYSLAGTNCVDFDAANMVARAQRLPVRDMNWCEAPGRSPSPGYNPRYTSGSAISGGR